MLIIVLICAAIWWFVEDVKLHRLLIFIVAATLIVWVLTACNVIPIFVHLP